VSACHWAEWTQREYDTTATAFYPHGGMEELVVQMLKRAKQQAAQHGHSLGVWTETTAQEVWRNTGSDAATHPYRVLVRNATGTQWIVARRVMLGIGTAPLSRLGGDLGLKLATAPQTKAVKNVSPVTVALQFPTRWWAAGETPGVSQRVMGESTCLARTEFHNTPEYAEMNVMRVAYSDGLCFATYANLDLLPEPARTNAIVDYTIADLRRIYPQYTIPNPIGYPWSGNSSDYVGVWFHIWCVCVLCSLHSNRAFLRYDGPWHWIRAGSSFQQDDIAAFATNPLPGEQVCLAGDAWDTEYSGWTTSAIRSSSWCLERFFPGRSAEWKPAATSCCEFRIRTNATVGPDQIPWYNWNARKGVLGCGEENWSPGPTYLAYERFWPYFNQTVPTGDAATCVLPRNPQTGAVDTHYCSVDAPKYRQPDQPTRKRSETKLTRPFHGR
jgi:hypothetical protein